VGRAAEWVAVRVEVPAAIADAVANFLLERGAAGIVTDDASARARIEAHVARGDESTLVHDLRRYLDSLAAMDAAWACGDVEVEPVPPVDWDAIFKTHHRPQPIGDRLLVAPPWDVPESRGREILIIEPGMAFGTGQHATTRTCLEEIEAAVAETSPRSALDVGTGSGVLAAACARLGVERVVALDLDPAVLPLARATFLNNEVPHVMLLGGPIAAVRGTFDLVVANLLADTLVREADALTATVAPTGHLVVSGILDDQTARVAAAFRGWRIAAERAENRWRTLRLVCERN